MAVKSGVSALALIIIFVVIIIVVIIASIAAIIVAIKKSNEKKNDSKVLEQQQNINVTSQQMEIPNVQPEQINSSPFERKYLLTKNEYYFYKELKRIADKYGFAVLSKIRFADIVQVNRSEVKSKSEWYSYFGKIKSKHIDFALADAKNLYVLLIIELDDNSHTLSSAKESDDFKNKVLEKCGYKVIRTYGPNNLETMVVDALQLQHSENQQEENNG